MNKKSFVLKELLIICAAVLLFAAPVYASTSDAVAQQIYTDSALARYGTNYETPFVLPGGSVDSTTGAVVIKETDVSLPGKNGFDLNIYREFSSFYTDHGHRYTNYESRRTFPMYLAVLYTYTLNGESKEIYIALNNEDEIQEEIYVSEAQLSSPKTDPYGLKYLVRKNLTSGGTVKLTWDKTASPDYVYTDRGYLMRYQECINSANVQIGHGWHINIPNIQELSQYVSESTRRATYTGYYDVSFEDGSKETLKYKYIHTYRTSDSPAYDEIHSAQIENGSDKYTVEIMEEKITDARGFEYNIKLSTVEGKNYYFCMNNIFNSSKAEIKAIDDKYGNCIRYIKIEGGWRIIDTYNRQVDILSGGITVTAGNLTKTITYTNEEIQDMDKNRSGYYQTFDEYKLNVSEYTDSDMTAAPKTTVYTMKNRCITDNDKYYNIYDDIVPILTSIDYPTDVICEYEYESTPGAFQRVFHSDGAPVNKSGDYFYPRVTKEILHEGGSIKSDKEFSYEGKWTEPPADVTAKSYKQFVTVRTLQNGHTEENTKDYDDVFRLIGDKTVYKDNGTEITSEETKYYYYNKNIGAYGTERKYLRDSTLKNTTYYIDNELITSKDSSYDPKSGLPLMQKNWEIQTDYTYDTTYNVPLTVTSNRFNASNIKSQNTLTSDKKSVATSAVYEGDELKEQKNYQYNSDGTLSRETVVNNGGNIVTDYAYNYADDCSYTVTATVSGIKNADGVSESISTTVSYDSLGRKISETDGNGNETEYQYNMLNQVTRRVNSDDTEQSVAYDIPNNKVTVTDEGGNLTTYKYTPAGKLSKIYLDNDESKSMAEYTYDKLDRTLTEKAYMNLDGDSASNEYTYDDLGRVLTKTEKENSTVLDTVTNTYTIPDDMCDVVNASGGDSIDVTNYKKAEIVFSTKALSSSATEGEMRIYLDDEEAYYQTFERRQVNTIVLDLTDVDTLMFWTIVGAYDVKVRLLDSDSSEDGMGGAYQSVTTTYVGDSNYTKPTTVSVTNGYGNKISESFYNGAPEEANLLNKNQYKYDYQGNVIETLGGRVYMENLGDYSTKTEYDYASRPIKEYRADGSYVTYTYDKAGNLLSQTDYAGKTTYHTYDSLGRRIKTISPFDGENCAEVLTYYDKNGNIIKSKQKSNAPGDTAKYSETETEYDSTNRVTAVKTNDGTEDTYIQYAYDEMGNPVRTVTGQTEKLTDLYNNLPDGVSAESFEYDRFGNATRHIDAMGNEETAEYNLIGKPTRATDRNGKVSEYMYNAYGSPTRVTDSSDLEYNIRTIYSVNNLPVRKMDMAYSMTKTACLQLYDDYGRVNVEIDMGAGVRTEYERDVNGNVKQMTVRENTSGAQAEMIVKCIYDKLDRLTAVNFDNGNTVRYTYDANGSVKSEVSPWNTVQYTYNDAGLITGMTNSAGTDYTCAYSLDGNKISQTDTENGTISYAYDKIGRLISETLTKDGAADTKTYSYDSRGNRSQMTENGAVTSYAYDLNNRLISQTTGNREINYTYDNNGNMLSKTVGASRNWTQRQPKLGLSLVGSGNGMETESADTPSTTLYTYNNLNQLVGVQTDNGLNAEYRYLANGLRASKTVNGVETRSIYSGSDIIMERDANKNEKARYYRGLSLTARKAAGEVAEYYTRDPHGSITSLESRSYTYDAFGNETEDNTTDENPFRYCGEYYDTESGLIYLRNRYYDPSVGRFISEDPVKDGSNWYVYCGNNPVMFVDPLGLFDYNTTLTFDPNKYDEDVVALQNELAYLGYLSIDDRDGYFGQKTLDAVNKYKDDMRLWNTGDYEGVVGLTTWKSLGLIYRTQDDINRGLQISLVGHKQYYDVSKMFNDVLWSSEQFLNSLGPIEKYKIWYDKVDHAGDWDIKVRKSWDKTFGGSYPGSSNALVVLYGELSTPEKMGNIFYGYTGSVMGFSENVLLSGSVYAARETLTDFEGVFEEFKDWVSIQRGVIWYKSKHPWNAIF